MRKLLMTVGFVVLSSCGPKVEVIVPLAIVSASPHDGATGIDRAAVPTLCFNRDMSAATPDLILESESGAAVSGQTVQATGNPRCLSISHDLLEPNTLYQVHAKLGLKAADGVELAADVVSHFRTAL
jgi:hypothetical protein